MVKAMLFVGVVCVLIAYYNRIIETDYEKAIRKQFVGVKQVSEVVETEEVVTVVEAVSGINEEALYSLMLNGFKRQAEKYQYKFKKAVSDDKQALASYSTEILRNKVIVKKYAHPRYKSKAVWVSFDEHGEELGRADKRKDSVEMAFVSLVA